MGISNLSAITRVTIVSAVLTASTLACQQKTEEKEESPPPSSANQTGTQTSVINSGGPVFYAGYDGSNDYSLLLPGSRDYTIADSSVATITKETVTLSEATITELIADAKASNPNFDETRFRTFVGREHPAYRITPLKAGQTTLTSTRGARGGRDAFGTGNATTGLVINAYTAEQYAAGQARYTTDGSGLLKACKSCHESGVEGAPPHELGNIKEISDEQGLTWITTGQVGTRVARITHTWDFNSDAERQGILPYLRAKSAKDIETFTKLVFEERIANFNANGGTP